MGAENLATAGLILELFPQIVSAVFVVRSVTPRATALVRKLEAEFPLVSFHVGVKEETSSLVKLADIICWCARVPEYPLPTLADG